MHAPPQPHANDGLELGLPDAPRRHLHREGITALSDGELLALVLGALPASSNTVLAAERILFRFGDARSMLRAGPGELAQVVGEARALRLLAAAELTRRAQCVPLSSRQPISSSREVVAAWGPRLREATDERVLAVVLDARQRPVAERVLALGGPSSCALRVREVFALAVREAGAAVVLVHNHPSGDPTPSADDRALTRTLVEAGRLLDVPLIDHVIIAREASFSFLDAGLLDAPARGAER